MRALMMSLSVVISGVVISPPAFAQKVDRAVWGDYCASLCERRITIPSGMNGCLTRCAANESINKRAKSAKPAAQGSSTRN
ncbi:MAG: hypothetical protein HC900_01915 [Methylacidiphilales bacterium]|nr:hypothetical protein [Candidatus Methylacidiphilales bacterium]